MNFFSIQKLFKRPQHVFADDPSKIVLTPYRDWRLIVICFFILLIAVVAAQVYLSISLEQDTFFSPSTSSSSMTFDRDVLVRTVQFYDANAAEFETVKSTPKDLVDPAVAR
ncbi:MAG: hypothetical protein ACYC8S_03150 [Minisyncoccota bacterium]